MTSQSYLPFIAAAFSAFLALAAATGKRNTLAGWCFVAGMAVFAFQYGVYGISTGQSQPAQILFWQKLALGAGSILPAIWLCFSLVYSRGNYREFLARWRVILCVLLILPGGLEIAFRRTLITGLFASNTGEFWVRFGTGALPINILLLITLILALMNLEKTFRTAVGIMRWRIKFLVIGLGLILGVRAYICSQALLFSGRNLAFAQLDAGALIIGGGPIIVAYLRRGLAEADIYPSHSVLENSITIVLAGAYLFVVGILSQIIRHLGNASDFQAQAFIVLLGIAGLATVACSERLRLRLRQFVSRHFIRPSHDFRKIWTSLTERLSSSLDKNALCGQATGLISETFNALSVTIWLLDERNEGLTFAASTCEARPGQERPEGPICRAQLAAELLRVGQPFELASVKKEWASPLRRITSRQFRAEGICVCVPLIAKDRCLGVAILTDRVYNTRYTVEEFDLLKCIGDQLAGALLNLRFSEELLANKEIEAFQTMSLFLVHDLKNAASALNLTVRNLPLHFDDPAFRKDALQSISTTVGRMNQLISRLSAFRQRLELNPVEADLNELIRDALADLTGVDSVEIVQDLHPLPKLTFDREKVHSVVTNLLLNARDAVGDRGQITVRTTEISGSAVLSVADNGCGMTPEFVRDSLFRPFQTTKKKGLGIGIFQSKTIVEAHHGSIHVESEPGKSTTFRISLPIGPLS